jgi:hypothetical protein
VILFFVHTHWSQAIRKPRSCWDLLSLHRKDWLPFLGVSHHAAHHLVSMRSYHQAMQTIRFKHETLRGENQRLSLSAGPHDNRTIVAAGLFEKWRELENYQMPSLVFLNLVLVDHGTPISYRETVPLRAWPNHRGWRR